MSEDISEFVTICIQLHFLQMLYVENIYIHTFLWIVKSIIFIKSLSLFIISLVSNVYIYGHYCGYIGSLVSLSVEVFRGVYASHVWGF